MAGKGTPAATPRPSNSPVRSCGELGPAALRQLRLDAEGIEESGYVVGGRATLRPDTDALRGQIGEGVDRSVAPCDEMEGRVVHREDGADRTELSPAGPAAGAAPGLQRRTGRDEAE